MWDARTTESDEQERKCGQAIFLVWGRDRTGERRPRKARWRARLRGGAAEDENRDNPGPALISGRVCDLWPADPVCGHLAGRRLRLFPEEGPERSGAAGPDRFCFRRHDGRFRLEPSDSRHGAVCRGGSLGFFAGGCRFLGRNPFSFGTGSSDSPPPPEKRTGGGTPHAAAAFYHDGAGRYPA